MSSSPYNQSVIGHSVGQVGCDASLEFSSDNPAPDPTNPLVVLMAVTVLARFDRVRSAAALSGGFITSAELAKLGVPYPTVTRWCANGLLARFHRGVYRVGGLSFGFDEAVHLASKLMTAQQAIGGRSALELWGLPGGSRAKVHVVGPKGYRSSSSYVSTKELRDLRPADVTTLSGLRVTTPSRSILDSSPFCSADTIGLQLTEGVQRQFFTYAELAQRVAEVSRPGKRGVSTLRKILAARTEDADRELNSYERMAKRLFRDAGFPSAVAQYHVAASGRSYFVDFAWPEYRLLVECDSMLAHSTPEQLQSDLRRQNDLIGFGWVLLRFTYADVADRPDYVETQLALYLPIKDTA